MWFEPLHLVTIKIATTKKPKKSITWRARALCLVLMWDAMPAFVVSLAVHPGLPRLTNMSQCRHFATRKSPNDSERSFKYVQPSTGWKWVHQGLVVFPLGGIVFFGWNDIGGDKWLFLEKGIFILRHFFVFNLFKYYSYGAPPFYRDSQQLDYP